MPLFQKQLGDYTDDDWIDFLAAIEESSRWNYQLHQDDIRSWNAALDPNQALFYVEHGSKLPSLNWLSTDFLYLPKWFVGLEDYDRRQLLSAYGNGASLKQTTDPLLSTDTKPWEDTYSYLVLYPNVEMSRILPYWVHFEYDVSYMLPVTE